MCCNASFVYLAATKRQAKWQNDCAVHGIWWFAKTKVAGGCVIDEGVGKKHGLPGSWQCAPATPFKLGGADSFSPVGTDEMTDRGKAIFHRRAASDGILGLFHEYEIAERNSRSRVFDGFTRGTPFRAERHESRRAIGKVSTQARHVCQSKKGFKATHFISADV